MAANALSRMFTLAVVIATAAAIMGAGQSQTLPEYPNVFSGSVLFAGEPAPDGVEIFARMGDYQSNVAREGFEADQRPIALTKDGGYVNLKVQPTGTNLVGKTITFFATFGHGEVQAEETVSFKRGPLFASGTNLSFPSLPPGSPVPTPVPTPTQPPQTPTPSPTPVLPIPGDTNIPQMSQLAVVVGVGAILAGGAMLLLVRRRKVS